MHRTWIWSLLWEDSICCGATKPKYHNYWGCELQLLSPSAVITEACEPVLRSKKSCLQLQSSPNLLQLEKASVQQWRPSTAKQTNKTQKKPTCDLITHLLKTIQWLASVRGKKKSKHDPQSSTAWSDPCLLLYRHLCSSHRPPRCSSDRRVCFSLRPLCLLFPLPETIFPWVLTCSFLVKKCF